MRVGLVGLDSSHAEHFVRDFNVSRVFGDARIDVLCGSDPARARALAEDGKVPLVVDEPRDMLGRVDAVIIGDRDGRLHREHAMPFLAAALPVFVDKPLAARLDDAEALVEAASRHGARLTSFSALRWARGMARIRRSGPGAPSVLLATGPADADSPWGGLSFYAVHMVEVALALVTGGVGAVRAFAGDDSVVATTTIGSTRVVFSFVRPAPQGTVPFRVDAVRPDGIAGGELTLGEHYLRAGTARFVSMARTGELPLPYSELLASVRLLERIDEAIGVVTSD